MTSESLVKFLRMRPFQPLTLHLVDGRTVEVAHPDLATLGRSVLDIWMMYPSGQVECIDAALIISIQTRDAADIHNFIE